MILLAQHFGYATVLAIRHPSRPVVHGFERDWLSASLCAHHVCAVGNPKTVLRFVAPTYHGAEKSAKVAQNLAVVEEFASLLEVLPYSAKASQHYGAIRAALDKVGRPICVNDQHIAAHARSEGLTLVTNNLGEFERVRGLLTENWVQSQA